MKKLLSLLSTLTIGSTAIPAGYAMYPYNLENNSYWARENCFRTKQATTWGSITDDATS
ncbi:hypothetical protein [Spiroplasma endosymbiont of Seladonia tumulorum]|uniref:hypothetical protein n=1 Tax=Spiroplasma endosymbiont of Seladonia tumulorum TaxID=3066321 RepID=UPI0030CF191B